MRCALPLGIRRRRLGKPIVGFGTADGEIDRNGSILGYETDVAKARLMGLPMHVEIFDVPIENYDLLSLEEVDDLVNVENQHCLSSHRTARSEQNGMYFSWSIYWAQQAGLSL